MGKSAVNILFFWRQLLSVFSSPSVSILGVAFIDGACYICLKLVVCDIVVVELSPKRGHCSSSLVDDLFKAALNLSTIIEC